MESGIGNLTLRSLPAPLNLKVFNWGASNESHKAGRVGGYIFL